MDESSPLTRKDPLRQTLQTLQREKEEAFEEMPFKHDLDRLGFMAYETDASGNVTYASRTSEALTGLPLKDIIGKPFVFFFTTKCQKVAMDVHQRTLQGESPEYELTLTNGKICRFRNEPIRDENGEVFGLFGVAKDVTEYKRLGEALRESAALYRTVVEDQTEMICRFRPDFTLKFVNGVCCRFFGKGEKALTGQKVMSLVLKQDRKRMEEHFRSLRPENCVDTKEYRVIGGDGKVHWQQWTTRAIFDEQGRVEEFQSVGREITERSRAEMRLRRAQDELERRVEERTAELLKVNRRLRSAIRERKRKESQLKESERKYRELADLLPQTIFELDETGRITFANRHGFHITGYSQEDFDRGVNSLQLFIHADRKKVKENTRRILSGEEIAGGTEYTLVRKDGSMFPVAVYSSPIIREGKITGLRGIAVDLTNLKKTENAIRESRKKLRHLYSKLIKAQEEERKALARDLHDGFIQSLAVLKLNTKIIKESCQCHDAKVDEIIEKSNALLAEMIEELRQITAGLRPGMLDHFGLIPALESYISTVFEDRRTKVHFSVAGFEERIDQDMEINLYRIIQEALSNIAKHANARNVWLTLEKNPSQIIVFVEDDGNGFEPKDAEEELAGQGLLSLRERVGLFGGEFRLDSAPGKGCRIEIEINVKT